MLSIGIGGSALGPEFVHDALGTPADKMAIHFIDNTDPDGMARVLGRLDGKLGQTLVLVISKSGGTPEPRNGMIVAAAAYKKAGLDFAKHAVAVTGLGSHLDKQAEKEGWLERFPMWDWVGGRTSETGPVGLLPAALQGLDIDALLAGAAACDAATRIHDTRKNPAAMMALAWYHATGGKGQKDMVVLPYKDRLLLFSRYLQQLVMESLGKRLNLKGERVDQGIAVYGNKGSTDQHAYVQQLRDGVNNFFAVFVRVMEEGGERVEVEPGVTPGDYLARFLGRHSAGALRERPAVDHDFSPARGRAHGGRPDRAVRAHRRLLCVAGRDQRLPPAGRGGRQKGGGGGVGVAGQGGRGTVGGAADGGSDRRYRRLGRGRRRGLRHPGAPGRQRSAQASDDADPAARTFRRVG